jgi:hypothetical protein
MTQAHWAIRFYLPFEEDKTIEFIGNYENAGKRFLDDIVVFSGIYGAPDYLIWKVHKDMIAYNFSSYSIDLKLFLDGDPESCYFQDNYRIVSVGDDLQSDRKVVYAIQEDYAKLDILLIEADISTLTYNETRTVEQLLIEVLEDTSVLPVVFCEHSELLLQSIKFEYSKFTLDPNWTVREFIQYIANENGFEWTIKFGILFIGPELYTYEEMKASKEVLNRQVDNISKNYWNMKITWSASPLNVLYAYELIDEEKLTDYRCIWAKHSVGSNGDTTKGCFIPVGRSISKESYYDSLEGNTERLDAVKYIFNDVKFNQVRLARATTDAGDTQFVDEVTIEKDILQYATKTPRNVPLNILNPLYTLPKVGRTTPYLDYQAGLFFPRSNNLQTNPNQLLFAPYDRLEQAVLGPFVMGNGSPGFIIPAKNPDDFRFQLPNGFCFYIKSDGTIIMQLRETTVSTIPSDIDSDKEGIVFFPSINDSTAQFRVKLDDDNFFAIQNKEYGMKLWSDGLIAGLGLKGILLAQELDETFIEITEDKTITIQKDANNKIVVDQSGKIDTKSESDTTLTVGGVAKIDATGNAILEGSSVLLGDSATLGIARLNDQIMSTITEDPAYWGYWITTYTAFLITWQAAITALIASGGTPAGVVAYGTAMAIAVATLQTGIPTTLTGKTTVASTKCKSE